MRKQPRAMVACGMKPDFTFNTKPMTCQLCRCDEVYQEIDNEQFRVNVCDDCGAWHVVSKGNGRAWWYFDAQLPSDMAPRFMQSIIESTT